MAMFDIMRKIDQAEHLISTDLDLKQPLQLRSDIKVQ